VSRWKQRYLGVYTFQNGVLEVYLHTSGMLAIRSGGEWRILNLVGQHTFAPMGAPAVRIRFNVVGDRAVAVTIHDGGPILTATRKG
jgi:hypothetical protein